MDGLCARKKKKKWDHIIRVSERLPPVPDPNTFPRALVYVITPRAKNNIKRTRKSIHRIIFMAS